MLTFLILVSMTVCESTSPVHLLQVRSKVDSESGLAHYAEFVENLAEKVAGHNYTLTQAETSALDVIRDFIKRLKKDMMTQLAEDQAEVDAARDGITSCGTTTSQGLNAVTGLKNTVNAAKSTHQQCRQGEVSKKDSASQNCLSYDTYRQSTAAAPPSCMSELTSNKISTSDVVVKIQMESCLELMQAWFPPLWDKYVLCRDAYKILNDTIKVCDGNQSRFESDFCAYAAKFQDTCDNQDSCRLLRLDERTNTHARVKVSETARKADFKTGEMVDCLFKVFEETNNTKKQGLFNACKSSVADTSTYDITYHVAPGAVACTPEANKPCDQPFLATYYTGQQWYAKAPTTDCTPCPAPTSPPAPPPTQPPAPGAFYKQKYTDSPCATWVQGGFGKYDASANVRSIEHCAKLAIEGGYGGFAIAISPNFGNGKNWEGQKYDNQACRGPGKTHCDFTVEGNPSPYCFLRGKSYASNNVCINYCAPGYGPTWATYSVDSNTNCPLDANMQYAGGFKDIP